MFRSGKRKQNPPAMMREDAARHDTGAEAPQSAPCTPLSQRRAGESLRIVELGGSPALKRRLRDLGLRPGKAIDICQQTAAGTVIAADGLKLALGADAAREVWVEERDGAAS